MFIVHSATFTNISFGMAMCTSYLGILEFNKIIDNYTNRKDGVSMTPNNKCEKHLF